MPRVNSLLWIITLNINRLISLIKRHRVVYELKKKKTRDMLSIDLIIHMG